MRLVYMLPFAVASLCCKEADRRGNQTCELDQPSTKANFIICNCERRFSASTVRHLTIFCPSQSIPSDLLTGVIKGPCTLDFIKNTFIKIPTFVSNIGSLEVLSFVDGELRELNEELRNLSSLTFLKIQNQRLQSIHAHAFRGLCKLLRLVLSNNRLTFLNLGIFDPLTELNELDLSFNELIYLNGVLQLRNIQNILLNNNNLHQIEEIFHRYMWSVRDLDLSNNELVILTGNTFRRRTSGVRKILLNNVGLITIHSTAFEDLTELRYLDLSFNKLEGFHVDTFSHNLKNLRILYVNNNRIRDINSLFAQTKRLEELNLDSNILRDLKDDLSNLLYLLKLTLDHNNVASLYSYNFRNLTTLYHLSIRHNKLSILEKGCFSELTSLRELYLSSNSITQLNGSLNSLEKLEVLAIDGNPLKHLYKEEFTDVRSLKVLLLNSTRLKTLDGILSYMSGLKHLDVRDNNVSTIETVSELRMAQNIRLTGNPWMCDCKLILMFSKMVSLMSTVMCYFPENFRGMPLKDVVGLSGRQMINNCPPGCSCYCIDRNYVTKNVYVNCSERNLTKPPSSLPEDTAILDLSKNRLTKLTSDTCGLFRDIIELNIEDNLVSYVDQCAIENLTALGLARNELSSPEFLLTEQKLKLVTLSGNHWVCNCGILNFRIWLISHKSVVEDIDKVICGYHEGSKDFNDKPVYKLTEYDLCPTEMALIISVSIGVLCSLLFLACIKILYTRYSINVKIWLYSKGFTFFKEDDANQENRFDVFISYSTYDEPFVINVLVPGLEEHEPHYSLCLHYRHFAPGEYIQDNIISAVQSSCLTIIILSKNFLTSEWCRLEFRVAYVRLLQDKVNRIVIIKYGDLPPLGEIEPAIRTHLESTTYLTWGERAFWQKLRYRMPKNRVSQNPNICDYNNLVIT